MQNLVTQKFKRNKNSIKLVWSSIHYCGIRNDCNELFNELLLTTTFTFQERAYSHQSTSLVICLLGKGTRKHRSYPSLPTSYATPGIPSCSSFYMVLNLFYYIPFICCWSTAPFQESFCCDAQLKVEKVRQFIRMNLHYSNYLFLYIFIIYLCSVIWQNNVWKSFPFSP